MEARTNKMERTELLREVRSLYQNLNAQMKLIAKSTEPALNDAYRHFQRLRKEFRYNDLSKYDTQVIKDIHRDLNYISGLKSSTLEGAIEGEKNFGEIKIFLNGLSETKRKEFFDIYDKLYNFTKADIVEKYKYDVFRAAKNEMLLGQTSDDIFELLLEKYNLAYEAGRTEEEQGEEFGAYLEVLYSNSFDELFDEYL